MPLTRPQRRQLSCWLIAALLFMQFAASAYACTRQTAPASAVAAQAACAGHQMLGADASQTSTTTSTPPLCKAHCEQGQQAVGTATTADAPTAPLLLAVLNWHAARPLPGSAVHPKRCAPMGTPPPGSPPLYLALLSLRN